MRLPTAAEIDRQNNIELANELFWEFCIYYDPEFFARRPFLRKIANAYQWLYNEYIQGRSKRISVSLPPRSGKSYITSLFCAWWIGKLPKLCVMRNSCTATLYDKLSRHVRNMVDDPRYKLVFPKVVLSKNNQALEGWSVEGSKQGSYFGGGVGTNIIGSGANLSINDDLYPGITQALSPGYNEKVIEWKESAADSRKETGCPELFIGTRWRKGDVIGKAIDEGKIDKEIAISALDYSDPAYPEGKSFCENVRTTAEYQETKKDVDPVIWEAEYQQNPIELKGLLFPMAELRKYNPKDIDVANLSIFRMGAIDPAKGGGDFFAFILGCLIGTDIFVHDVIFNTDLSDLNEVSSFDFAKKHDISEIKFEGNGAWYLMGQTIRGAIQKAKLNCSLRIYDATANKHARILAQAGFIKNHMVFRQDYDTMTDYRAFMRNLTQYMKTGDTAHDDAPDVTAALAKYYREYYKTLWN